MTKLLKISFLLILVLNGVLLDSCDDQETYDFFSYKAGNEYYYKYYRSRNLPVQEITEGIETWRVISENSFNDSTIFTIERKLNATLCVFGCTTIISDSIRFIDAIEYKKKSTFSLFGFSVLRYQENPKIEVELNSGGQVCRCTFKADSGLTKYYYYHPPNHVVHETLLLDSVKIAQ